MEKKPFSPCDYVSRVQDNQPKELTRELFLTLLEDMDVRLNCEIIRGHDSHAEVYKRLLPGICWQSKFDGQLRTDKNAQATGFFCLDVDIHHEEEFKRLLQTEGVSAAYRWAEKEAQERAKCWTRMAEAETSIAPPIGGELDIVAIHISPSGTGVHVVALCNPACNSIAEDQARLAHLLGTSYDTVCKDAARVFFVTPREDWLYLDYKTLLQEETPLPTSPEGEE